MAKRAAVFVAVAIGVLVATSCSDGAHDRRQCDYTVTRCATVCDYWCDGWGCWPSCVDRCWDDCYANPAPPGVPVGSSSGASADAGVSAPPPVSVDGGLRSGRGVLCSPCAANDECESGALCIFRGGPADAGASGGKAGFCGHACQASSDCAQGFTCTQLGTAKQCLPNSGTCP